ncbi:hypothetical protein LX36DRAFT_655952, partial [Colletotrichum falcatum]
MATGRETPPIPSSCSLPFSLCFGRVAAEEMRHATLHTDRRIGSPEREEENSLKKMISTPVAGGMLQDPLRSDATLFFVC